MTLAELADIIFPRVLEKNEEKIKNNTLRLNPTLIYEILSELEQAGVILINTNNTSPDKDILLNNAIDNWFPSECPDASELPLLREAEYQGLLIFTENDRVK